MANRVYNALFVCTGNSSRSVLAEAVLNQLEKGKFRAWSAGSHPTGRINPYTVETLRRRIELLMALPVDKLDRLAIQREVDDIGTRLAEPKSNNVLILCTHNSARSVLAECMLNHLAERFHVDVRAYSAGSAPSGRVNPMALRVLKEAGVDTSYVRSKSWDELSKPDAPHMRIVITVCDQAAAETCPFWPGAPVQVHWGYPDPSRVEGTEGERQQAFELTRQALAYKITQLLFMPLDVMDNQDLRRLLQTISES